VDAYGRGIKIDPQAISSVLAEIDPQQPESLQEALSSGLFEPEQSEAQLAALRRLETLLALIEGWVDVVVLAAAEERLQSAQVLAEAMRRRRAAGGPAEQTFATLVGLELRPRRLRDAAALWGAMGQLHGTSARDGLWHHPDLLPTSDDLDDPVGYASNYGGSSALKIPDDLSELDELTEELTQGQPPSTEGQPTPASGGQPSEAVDDHESNGSASTGSMPEDSASTDRPADTPARERPEASDEPGGRAVPGETGSNPGSPEGSSPDGSQSDSPGS
jgi:hypothetical protein